MRSRVARCRFCYQASQQPCRQHQTQRRNKTGKKNVVKSEFPDQRQLFGGPLKCHRNG
jgi:hypothetical protein